MKRCTNLIHAGATVLALFPVLHAMAADVAGATTGNITVVSDYLFRGLSQTNRKPALQAGVEYAAAGGWYVGGWGSNVSWLADASTPAQPLSSSLEMDVYTGYRGRFGNDWSYDAGLYGYVYPGSYPHGYTRPHTLEGYAALGWKTLTLKYSQSFGNLFGYADSQYSRYLDLSWNAEFAPGWFVNAHVGHQAVAHHAMLSYSDWKLGVTRNLAQGWSAALGYYDSDARASLYTNAEGHDLGRATGVLSFAKGF